MVVPTPFPPADWPESPAATHTQYAPTTDALPEPAYTLIDSVANGQALTAAASNQPTAPTIDTEAGKTGVVVGVATATLDAAAGKTQLGSVDICLLSPSDRHFQSAGHLRA